MTLVKTKKKEAAQKLFVDRRGREVVLYDDKIYLYENALVGEFGENLQEYAELVLLYERAKILPFRTKSA